MQLQLISVNGVDFGAEAAQSGHSRTRGVSAF